MTTSAGRSARLAFVLSLGVASVICFPPVARAQEGGAWLPFRGEGYLSLIYQRVDFSGHFDTDTSRLPACATSSADTALADFEYGVTDKVAVRARLPFVSSRFTGPDDDPCIVDLRDLYKQLCELYPDECRHSLDTGERYSTFQDFGFSVRYNLIDRAIVVTPSLAVTIPSHDYETIGEAAAGQNRRALHLGVSVGALTEPRLPHGYMQFRYAYSFVQPIYGISLNRSNAEFEAGYGLTPLVQIRGLVSWQRTHGGIPYLDAVDQAFNGGQPLLFFDHDRLLASRYWHVGAGATISITDRIDFEAAVHSMVAGADSHYGVGFHAGVTFRLFEARALSRSTPHH